MSELLYNEVLLDHNVHPQHKGQLKQKNRECTITNASCGDKLTIELQIKNGVIQNAAFDGVGCAISQASADIMIDLLIGKTIAEAQKIYEAFNQMIANGTSDEKVLGEAMALKDISTMPARVKCAELAWRVIKTLWFINR